jgi:hypothetical protein
MAKDVTTSNNKAPSAVQPARIDGREGIWNRNILSDLLRKAKDEARWGAGFLTVGILERFALPTVSHSHGWDYYGYFFMVFGAAQLASALEARVMAGKLAREMKQKKPEEIALEKYGYGRSSEHVRNAVVYGAYSGASFYCMANPGADKSLMWWGLGFGLGIAAITAWEIRGIFKSLRRERNEAAGIALRQSSEATKEADRSNQGKA